MPDLKLLRDELKQTLDARVALKAKYQEGPMPADVVAEDVRLHERALKLHPLIEAEEESARDADFKKLTKFMSDPDYRIPRAAIGEAGDFRKALMSAGWEIKNGIVSAPTTLGKSVEMFGEDVLFGPLPDKDQDARKYFQQTRAIFDPTYRAAYVKWLRSPYRNDGMAFSTLDAGEQKALSEGTDSAGGFLVPPDIQAEILVRTAQTSIMQRLVRSVTTSRDRLTFPRVNPHASSGSIYSSGFVGSMVGETPAFTDTDPAFGTFEVSIKKARAATKVSNDFLTDAAANVLAFLSQNGAENLGLVMDSQILTGDGTALNLLGLLNDGGLTTVDVEGSTANTISNTTSSTGSAPKLIDVAYALPSQYANNASWVMRRAIEGKVRKLVDGSGRFLWPPMIASGFAAVTREILGYPVYNSEFMPNDGTDTNKVLLFGDLSSYIFVTRAQLSTVILRERFADTDQTGIILFSRFGGALWNNDAVRVGVV